MPTIICSYCMYVGQGHNEGQEDTILIAWQDVEKHEQTCQQKISEDSSHTLSEE
ncbi:MAG TPA: hypothetical protein VEP90_19150 [Methylomirabilota bacterium]|nr:hypothetical protein [Methylomirabilota bacterium]